MQKSIDITTTQNVTIEYELARLRERALALVLDWVIILVGYVVLIQLIRAVVPSAFLSNMAWEVLLFLMPIVSFFLYNILFDLLNTGQTPGKLAMGLKVVRLDGKEPEWPDVVLRALLHLVDSMFSFGLIGVVLIKTTDKSQRFGDMAAHTSVIRIQSSRYLFRLEDILTISTLDNYQPVYPQVVNLNESDMLFIKNAVTRYQEYGNRAHEELLEDLVTHLMPLLDVRIRPMNRIDFLKTLLRDYVVLTR